MKDDSKAFEAIRRVLAIHVPETEYPDYRTGQFPCEECNRSDQEGLHPTFWPCPTVRAIKEAIQED